MKSADPRVPQSDVLANVQEFCDIAEPFAVSARIDRMFLEAMREITAWHRDRSPFYSRFLRQADFTPADLRTMDDLARLPFVPAASFKEHEILSVPRDEIAVHLTSSGTMGQKSQIFFDAWSIGSAQRMLDRILEFHAMTDSDQPVNYLLYTYEPRADMKLGTSFTDHYLCKYAPAADVFYALRNDGAGGHEFDVFGCIDFLRKSARDRRPVRIFGFPAFLYFTVKRMRELRQAPLRLHSDSLVFLGGGWKGHADQAIDKFKFYAELSETLGLADRRMRDGFGSVEHCVPYVECAKHRLHVPTWSRVVIRETATLRPVENGTPGFLQFISPYITSVPAHSVLMGDLAVRHAGADCGCGLPTDWFDILGRAGTSKNKSCAVAASELLKGRS